MSKHKNCIECGTENVEYAKCCNNCGANLLKFESKDIIREKKDTYVPLNKKPLLIILIIAIILSATNPNLSDFSNYLEHELKQTLGNQEEGYFDIVLSSLSSLTASVSSYFVERKSFLIFSTYSIEILDVEYKYIGIFGLFIRL